MLGRPLADTEPRAEGKVLARERLESWVQRRTWCVMDSREETTSEDQRSGRGPWSELLPQARDNWVFFNLLVGGVGARTQGVRVRLAPGQDLVLAHINL